MTGYDPSLTAPLPQLRPLDTDDPAELRAVALEARDRMIGLHAEVVRLNVELQQLRLESNATAHSGAVSRAKAVARRVPGLARVVRVLRSGRRGR